MQTVKNFLYNLSYQLLVILLPLITIPYVSNILGAEGIGDYAFTFANTQYFVLFGMVGISLYGNRQIAYVREDERNLKNTFYSIYSLQLIMTSISLLMFILFVALFQQGRYKILYMVQGIYIIAAMVDISWLFMGLEEFKKTVIRNTMVKLVGFISIFIFIKDSNDIVSYCIILSLSAFIGNLTLWFYIPKRIGINKFKIKNLNIHLKSSLALFVPQIAIQIYLLLDRTLLGLMTDNIQVGYYENAQKIVKITLTIATAIGTIMMPKVANTVASGDMKKVKQYIENSFFFVSALAIPLMFGLMGVTDELAPWFFTDKFSGIENLIKVSSVIILAISWSNVMGMQLLVPLNRTKQFTSSVTIGAVINFVLNLFLLKTFGAIGACISTIIAEFTVTITQFYFVKDFIDPIKLINKILIFIPAGLIMYLVVRLVGINMGASIVTNITQVIIGAITYFAIIELSYRLLKKQSTTTYIKEVVK